MFSKNNNAVKNSNWKFTIFVISLFVVYLGCNLDCFAEGKKERILKLVRKSDCSTLDSAQAMDIPTIQILLHLYEPLLHFDNNTGKIKPNIAQEWKISSDGKVYTLNLRKDIKFSDGSPLTASDAVFSFKRQLSPDVPGYVAKSMTLIFGLQKIIKDVKAIGDYTVEIKLSSPFPYLLKHLASFYLSILSKNSPKDDAGRITQPIGSGAYILKKRVIGESMILERNPYYFKKGAFDTIFVQILNDDTSRLLLAQKGEVDIVEDIPPDQLPLLKKFLGITIQRYSPTNIVLLAFNVKRSFSSNESRLFAASKINPEEISKVLLHGEAKVLYTVIPQGVAPELEKRLGKKQYFNIKDKKLEKPKELKEQKISILATPGNSEIAKIIAGQLQKVNLQATVESYDVPTTVARLKSGDFDLAVFQWNGLIPDLSNYLKIMFHSSVAGLTNFSFYSNEKLDKLIDQFGGASKEEEQALLLEKIVGILNTDLPILPLFQKNHLLVVKKGIQIPQWGFPGLPFYFSPNQ